MALLPKPYEDEAAGSVIARACLHSGIKLTALRASLGAGMGQDTFLMTTGVRELALRAGVLPQEFLEQNTIFPYAMAFAASELRRSTAEKFLAPYGAAKTLGAPTRLATVGVRYRRFCRSCVELDLVRFGESYWRRTHQLRGVWVCHIHGEPLFDSEALLRDASTSNFLLLPQHIKQHLPSHSRPVPRSWRLVARASADTLSGMTPGDVDWSSFYRARAAELGFTLGGGSVASIALAAEMVGFFKAEELAAAGCPISAATRYPWPCSLVLPNWTGKASTIKHLLMHVFLANAAPVALSRAKIYLAPGKPTRNYGNLDAASAGKLRLLVAQLAADGARSTVKALLTHIGILGAYSHNRQFFPKTAALIDEFKRSEQSTRKLGGRPRQRAHMY